MKLRWKRGQAIVAVLCVVLMLVVAACGSDDDDDDTTPTTTAATATTGSSGSDTTATTGDDADATGTGSDTAAGTATEADDDSTAASTSQSETTATESSSTTTSTSSDSTATMSTSTSDATSTTGNGSTSTQPTGSSSSTAGTGEVAVPDVETLDPEKLPNFSMRMNFDATNFSGTPATSLVIEMQQSEIGSYHMRMETDGEGLEFWTIGSQSWTSIGGEIIESPTGALFDPADILTTGELIPEGLEAREDGKETINGRETTRWVMDGSDYVDYMNEQTMAEGVTTVEMSDGAGEVVIWIDDELNIMIKAEGDVTWTNSDSTDGSLIYDYEIHDIGTTAEITVPE